MGNAKRLNLLITNAKDAVEIDVAEKANVEEEEVATKYSLKGNAKIVVDTPSPYVKISASAPISATLSAIYRRPIQLGL
ncbi:MAG: hypothetical protein ACP5UU_05920 [Thermoprotei archaeon]